MFRSCSLTLAAVAVLGSTPLSMTVYAQSCEQELARQDAALRQFETDARRESVGFLLEDVRRGALGVAAKRLRGDPTADAARDIKARWEEYQAYVDQGRTFQTVTTALSECLRGGKTGCMEQIGQGIDRFIEAGNLAARIGDAVKKWIESLGNESISRAVDRVERVKGILENFTKRAAGTATQAASQGIASCLSDLDQRVRQTQRNSTPVDPNTAPRGGSSVGKLVGIAGAVAVAGGVGIWASGVIDEAGSTTGAPGGGATNGSSQMRVVGNPVIQCTRVGGASLQSLCVGPITLEVGNVFNSGAQVCIRTVPDGLPACQSKGSSTQIMFQIEERIINVDANGNITNCRQTQTGVAVFLGSPSGTATANVNASIPMACR